MSKKAPPQKPKNAKPAVPARKADELKSYPQSWYYCCWLLYACYCYAALFPMGPVWGIHFIAYVPVVVRLPLLALGALMLNPRVERAVFRKVAGFVDATKARRKYWMLRPAIVAAICFVLFRTFTIQTDIYGDSVNMLKWYGDNTKFDWHWVTDVLSPHLVDNKEALTVAVHRIVAYVFSISIESSYRIVSALCGALFIFVWLVFVQRIAKRADGSSNGGLRLILVLLGIFSGSVQVFFGHIENYAFGILTSTLFLVALYYYIEEEIGTLVFLLLYLLAFKAHIITILFVPAVLVALAYHYRNSSLSLQSLFTWRAIVRVVVFPALVIGLALYVFVFHSWNEPYALSAGRQFQQTFLPIVLLPGPLNHYSLWSPYHIADFFNILLLTCAPIVVVLLNVMIFNRRDISWSQPRVMIFALAALFPFMFFMAMNPTLSPVRDWDVYTLLFPPVLFFASVLLTQERVRVYASAWLSQALVFGMMFTIVLISVDATPLELQTRLQDAGAYTYHSYYAGSDYIEARSFALADTSEDAQGHFASIVSTMAQAPTTGKDVELGKMMSRLASFYAFIGNGDSAVIWAAQAYRTDTKTHRYSVDLAAYYVQMNRLEEGAKTVEEILKNKASRNDTDHSDDVELAATMSQLGARYSRTGNDSLTVFWASAARKFDPHNLSYIYDAADYYVQTKRPLQALNVLRTIPPDSVSIQSLTATALAAVEAFGADSGLAYLNKAHAMAPNNRSIDSLIEEMKARTRRR